MPFPTSSPLHLSPEALNDSRVTDVYVTVAVSSVIASIGIILRFVSRRLSHTRLSYDDYLILAAWMAVVVHNILMGLDAAHWGLAHHLPAVPHLMPSFQKAALVIFPLYFTASFFIKGSLLALYYRLFAPIRKFRIAVYISAIIVFAQWICVFFATIFQCVPVRAFWDLHIEHARCMNLPTFGLISGALNLATDVMILCLPLPIVWSLNTNKVQRFTLTGIFLLGAFVCITSIVRITKLAEVNYNDPTWRLVDVYQWSAVEAGVGVLSACLPTMRPLFSLFIPLLSVATKSSSGKGTVSTNLERRQKRFAKLDEEAGLGYIDHEHAHDLCLKDGIVVRHDIKQMHGPSEKPLSSEPRTNVTSPAKSFNESFFFFDK